MRKATRHRNGLLLWILIACVSISRWDCEAFAATKGGFGKTTSKKTYTVVEDDDACQALISVLRQQKSVIRDTEIGIDPTTGRRGLYSSKKISKDKLICKVPSDLAIALSDPSQNGKDAPTIVHNAANYLKNFANHPQQSQQWSFYLNTLPKVAPNTPHLYNDQEVELLEFPKLVQQVQERQQLIQQVASEQNLDAAELAQATALVSSRSLALVVAQADDYLETEAGDVALDDRGQVVTKAGERQTIQVLVPYLDLVNHRSQNHCNAKWTVLDPEQDDAWFALVATRNIPPHKEITISYGSGVETSDELLLNYGFVDANNPVDKFMLDRQKEGCMQRDEWETTLEEDRSMLDMLLKQQQGSDDDPSNLQAILEFRIQMKASYKEE